MSSRQKRRYQNQLASRQVPVQDDLENEDFEPLYVRNQPSTSYDLLAPEDGAANEDLNDSFALLMLPSPEGSELGSEADEEITSGEPQVARPKKKKKNHRKKKHDKKRSINGSTTDAVRDPLDEVARALAEVNLLMGGEPAASIPEPEISPAELRLRRGRELLRVNHKGLDAESNFTRRFGPAENACPRPRRENVLRQHKRHIVLPDDTHHLALNGLSMERIATEGNIKYFKFVHSPRYQRQVRGVVDFVKYNLHSGQLLRSDQDVDSIEEVILNIDYYFSIEELGLANSALDMVVHTIQCVFPPSFNYVDGISRVEYKYVENRVFHIVLLKYLYMQTNKACHHTALEVAKLMLSLDPSDPLAVIFIIDTLALRAYEFQWLVELYKYWSETKDAGVLFNMMFSNALALFNIYLVDKKTESLEEADRHLREAVKRFPYVALMILQRCQKSTPLLDDDALFARLAKVMTPHNIREFQALYVAFVCPKWRENDAGNWLRRICESIASEFTNDLTKKGEYCNLVTAQGAMFSRLPEQIKRHLYVIKSMSSLLADGAVPELPETFNFNPFPNEGTSIDEYKYYITEEASGAGAWALFSGALFPNTSD